MIPGLAHVQYWTDREIHQRIIRNLMRLAPVETTPEVESRPWAFLQPIGDKVLYVVVRLLLLTMILVCIERLASPFHPQRFFPDWQRFCLKAFYGTGIALEGLTLLRRLWPHWLPFGLNAARVLGVAAMGVLALGIPPFGAPVTSPELAAMFATALAATILLWMLHTRLHRGLVQMWRYTQGEDRWTDTSVKFVGASMRAAVRITKQGYRLLRNAPSSIRSWATTLPGRIKSVSR